MEQWFMESKNILKNAPKKFGILVDMRSLKPLPTDSQVIMHKGQKLFRQSGMVRSVVIIDNIITKMQFIRIGQATGIYEWERYIDATSTENWEEIGIDWIVSDLHPTNCTLS